MQSSETKIDEVNWRTEYLQLLSEHEIFLNRFFNARKRNMELMRLLAQHEETEEEDKKDQE